MKSDRPVRVRIPGPATLGFLFAIVFLPGCGKGPLRYSVTFPQTGELKAGDPASLDGTEIGRVERVEKESSGGNGRVDLRIEARHRNKVLAESTAVVRRSDASPGSDKNRWEVEILNPPGGITPLPDGSTVKGLGTAMEAEAWKLGGQLDEWGKTLESIARDVGKGAQKAVEGAREALDSDKSRRLVEELSRFMAEIGEKGRQGAGQLNEEWKRLLERTGPEIEKLSKSGKDALARSIKALVEEIEKRLKDLQTSPPGGADPAKPKPADEPIRI